MKRIDHQVFLRKRRCQLFSRRGGRYVMIRGTMQHGRARLSSIRLANTLPGKLCFVILCLNLLLGTAGVGKAQVQDDDIRLSAKIGYDGFCMQESWLPIHVEVENLGQGLSAVIEASYQTGSRGDTITRRELELPTNSRKEVFLYLHYSEDYNQKVTVSLLDGKKVVEQVSYRMNCLNDDSTIIGVLSDNPSAYDVLNDVKPLRGIVRVAQLTISDLPDHSQAWNMLHALVISNVDTGSFSSDQKLALRDWIASGGKLFLVGSLNWNPMAAGMGDLLPLEIASTRRVRSLSQLQSYARVEEPLDSEAVLVTGTLREDSTVLLQQEGIPLLIEKRFGFGHVFFLATDPALQPLRDWSGMKAVYEHLLTPNPQPVPWADGIYTSYQANQALAAIPELGLPSALYIWCLLGLYVIIIGPLNYFALRRFKRRELGWFTIPVLVIVFSGLAYGTGYFYRGVTPTLNRLAVIQAWDGVDTAKVNALVGIYSPVRRKYDLLANDKFFVQPFIGGETDLQGNDQWITVHGDSGMSLPGVTSEIASMKSAALVGSMPALDIRHDLALTLSKANPMLSGNVTNGSPYKLRDAIVVAGGHWRRLGDIEPGEVKSVRVGMSPFSSSSAAMFFNTDSLKLLQIDYSDLDSNEDVARRYAFLDVLLRSNYETVYGNSGVYLLGWVDGMSLPVTLQDQNPNTIDTILYAAQLRPSIQTEPGDLSLPMTLFTWESSMPSASPYYASDLQSNGYVLRFVPSIPIQYRTIKSLSLDLQTNVIFEDLVVSLWDFDRQSWVRIPVTSTLTDISEPERFVGPDSEIRLQVRTTSSTWAEMRASSLRLVVTP